jgi:hypothetical protein
MTYRAVLGVVLLSSACVRTSQPAVEPYPRSITSDRLRFEAEQVGGSDYLQVRVHVTNLGDEPRSIAIDMCTMRLMVFAGKPAVGSEPVWEDPAATQPCERILSLPAVEPGDTKLMFGRDVIVGSSGADLTPGSYYAVIIVRIQGADRELRLASDEWRW